MPLIEISDHNSSIAVYIDRKADFARKQAKGGTESEFYTHLAMVLDNLADEIRMGLCDNEEAG